MADFTLSRCARIQADPARIHALLDDFREWQRWSPWEGSDLIPRTCTGPAHGVVST